MHEMVMDTGLTDVINTERHSLPERSHISVPFLEIKQHHQIELE